MAVQIIILFSITTLAYFIKGLTGFGNTLVMNSLFAFLKENRFTTPIDLLLSIPTNIYMAWRNRKSLHFKIILPLSVAVVLGNIPGILLLSAGSDRILKLILGAVLFIHGLALLTRKTHTSTEKNGMAEQSLLWIVGLISGVLMGLFGIGALLAGYITRHAKDRHDYRGNLCCVFVMDNLFRLFGYWYRGILNRQIFLFSFLLIPAAIGGLLISSKIDWRFSEASIRRMVLILLILSGAALIIKSSFGF